MPEFGVWISMRRRCNDPKDDFYDQYGGRGICVCERWKSFGAFYEDMGPRPARSYSIDRINNNGNYEPGNCRWATSTEQARNTSGNRVICCEGKSMCVAEWAEHLGVRKASLYRRLWNGWTKEETVTVPIRQWRRK